MVALGYGKYWRADRIVGLMPIADGRGPGQRTEVFVEDRREPLVASRTEDAILADMGTGDEGAHTAMLRAATVELLEAFHEFSPVLRRALLHEHHFDVERWEERLGALLRHATPPDQVGQNELFR
jgi:hypothetical protein